MAVTIIHYPDNVSNCRSIQFENLAQIQQITGQEDWMRLTNDIARNENSSQGLH